MKQALIGVLAAIITCHYCAVNAQFIPTGYNSWCDSNDAARQVVVLGAEPENYWDGARWTASNPDYENTPEGWKSVRNRHYVYIDTVNNTVRFAMSGADSTLHVLKTRIGPLFFFNRVTKDTTRLASPRLAGWSGSNDTVRIDDVYPGVNCLIWNRKGGLDHRFIFSVRADSLIDSAWRNAGSDSNSYTVNTFRLLVDSLDLSASDDSSGLDFSSPRDIRGQICFDAAHERLFSMPAGWVRPLASGGDTLQVKLYRRLHRFGSQVWFFEGFRNKDIHAWPQSGYWHDLSTQSQVGASSDDAGTAGTGAPTWSTSLTYVALGCGDNGYKTGWRFTNVTIPAGSTINSCSLQVAGFATNGDGTLVRFRCEASDNAPTFSTEANYDARSRTSGYVDATITAAWSGGNPYKLPGNFSPLVQEVTDRPGWVSGSALVLFCANNGSPVNHNHQAYTYDYNTLCVAKLTILYTSAWVFNRRARIIKDFLLEDDE